MNLHLEDRALAKRVRRGDERAFEAFFQRHFSVAYRFSLRRMGGDEAAAEEVAQSTVCTALARIGTYRGEAALLTWVLTICRREIANWYRAEGRHAAAVPVADLDDELASALESLTDTGDDPEKMAERAEVRERIQRALDRVHPRHRQALSWKYIQGRSVREISERLEVSEKAAESVLTRARNSFREAYLVLASSPLRSAAVDRSRT